MPASQDPKEAIVAVQTVRHSKQPWLPGTANSTWLL